MRRGKSIRTLRFSLLTLSLFLFSLFSQVNADADVDITQIPEKMGEYLGVPSPDRAFVGGILTTAIFMLVFVLPTLMLRTKSIAMIMALLVLTFSVGVGWLDVWIMLVVIMLISLNWASKLKRMLT